MMRATGFLAGVCLTVAAFLLVLDKRESQRQETLMETTRDATVEELSGVIAAIAEQVDVVQAEDGTGGAVPPAHEPAPAADHRLELPAEAQADGTDQEDSANAGTYLFWSPFRSEWSAQGFAGRLTSATQVAVEVVHAGPGKYRVAFSYQNENERLARIEHIETITGLKLE